MVSLCTDCKGKLLLLGSGILAIFAETLVPELRLATNEVILGDL